MGVVGGDIGMTRTEMCFVHARKMFGLRMSGRVVHFGYVFGGYGVMSRMDIGRRVWRRRRGL